MLTQYKMWRKNKDLVQNIWLCAQTIVPLHRQKTNIDCLG